MAAVNFDNSPVLVKEGPHYVYRNQEFWAEDGIIVIEDRRDGNVECILRKELAFRTAAINLEIKRCRWNDQRDALHDLVQMCYSCWKDAKEQGDPSDPDVVRQRVRERRRAVLVTGMW